MIKQTIILNIKDIIKTYGETNSKYLKLVKYNCQFLFKNKSITHLLETYKLNSISIIAYINNKEVKQIEVTYDSLEDKVLKQIFKVLKQYEKRKVSDKFLSII